MPVAGVLWYQGESNVGEETYPLKLKALADGWRKAWGYDFPFCVFQLSSVGQPDPDPEQNQARPRTRDDQRRASEEIPDCGFVVTTDVGATYGGGLVAADKDPEKPGVAPVPKNTRNVKGFTIQDESGKWHTAEAVIDGDCVVVSAQRVTNPKGVRYAHMTNTMGLADLYNAEGLPAVAFRTDTGKAGAK